MVSLSYHFIRAYHFRKCQFERCQSHFWCISLLRAVGAFYAEYQLEMNLLFMNVPRIWFAQYMTLTAGQSIMIVATDTENRMCFIILQEKQMHYVSTFHPLWEFSITGCVPIPKYDWEIQHAQSSSSGVYAHDLQLNKVGTSWRNIKSCYVNSKCRECIPGSAHTHPQLVKE